VRIPDQRDRLARALDCFCRRSGRNSGRSLRNWRRRDHRSGAVRSIPRARCAGRRPYPGLHRHVARDHRADDRAFLSWPQEERLGNPRSPANLGSARYRRRGARITDRFVCTRLRVQARLFVFVSFISVSVLFGGGGWKLGDQLPGRGVLAIYGLITGLVSSLVGVSGGAVSNAVLTLYGRPMHQAVGTSAGVGVPITIAGTVGYVLAGWPHMAQLPPLSVGYVSLVGLILMAPVSSFTTSYGVRLAHWLPRRKLEIAFGLFLVLVALRFVASMV